jgi:drug/metabolite transporter (DMT)-like permease/GNAT superfamily N-acetyltransferase
MASAVREDGVDYRRSATADADATELLNAYAAELADREVLRECYRSETVPAEYVEPEGGAFLVLYQDARPIGCGGIRRLGDGVGELKRMYVIPGARGSGHGARLLAALEDEARRLGYERLRLDTAAQLKEAQHLYEAAGYRQIPDYNGNTAASHWFEKDLTPAAGDAKPGAAPPTWMVWSALATVYLVWGSTYLAIRVMVETMPALLAAGVRFLVAGIAFYLVLRVRRGAAAVRFGRPQLLAATGVGLLLPFGGNGLVTIAERHVPSGLAALIIASVPLWVVIMRAISRDRVPRLTVLGVMIGFAGVAVLLLPGKQPGGASIGGMLLIVLAAISWACGSYYSRRWPLPSDVFLATALEMICGGAAMVGVALIAGEASDVHVSEFSLKSIAGFAWLVTFGSIAAYTAYVWLLKNVPISKVATYAYVNPVVAIFLGWALLSEQITVTIVVGAALILASVALVVSRESG